MAHAAREPGHAACALDGLKDRTFLGGCSSRGETCLSAVVNAADWGPKRPLGLRPLLTWRLPSKAGALSEGK